jgi:hypothetical protein
MMLRNAVFRLSIPDTFISNEFRNGKTPQEKLPKAPFRAIIIKGNALRAAIRNGNRLDYSDLYERFVDLWQEARLGHLAGQAQQGRL